MELLPWYYFQHAKHTAGIMQQALVGEAPDEVSNIKGIGLRERTTRGGQDAGAKDANVGQRLAWVGWAK